MTKKNTLGNLGRPSFPAALLGAAATLLIASASILQAQTYTWTGGSTTSSNWSDHLNWSVSPANSNSTPLAGLSSGLYLVFPARTSYGKTVATNDITGITGIDGVAFVTTNGFFTGQPVQTDATPAANLIYFTNNNSGGTSNNWGINTTLNAGTCVYGNNGGNIITFSGVLSGNGQFYAQGSTMGQQQIYLLNTGNTFNGQGTGTWGQYEPVGQDSENGPIEVFSGWLWFTSMATSNNASALGKASSTHSGYTGQIALPGQGWSGSGSPLYIGYIGTTSCTSDAPWGLAYYQTGTGRMLSISNNSPNNSSLTWTGPWTTGFLTGSTQPYTFNLGGTSTGVNTVLQSIAINWGGTTLAETMNINGPGTWVFCGQSNGLTGAATFAANANVMIRSNDAWFASSISMASGGTLDLTWNDTNKGTYTGPFTIGTNGIQTFTAGHVGTATGTDIMGSLAIATTNTFVSPTKGGTLNVAGTGTAGTLTITTNLSDGPNSSSTSNVTFVPSGGALYMDFGTNNTVGAGSNDLIVVRGNLDLSQGICQITPNVLYPNVSNSVTEPAGLQGNATYTLITYTGTLKPHSSGSTGINVAVPAGYSAATIATNVAGSVTVTFTAGKITPTITAWPTASAITYGQTLASSTLSGGSASVGGTFAWTTPSTQPGAGNPSESVTFTPTDTTDYNSVVGSVNVTVNKATPTVTTWPTASAITYGQTLASSTLSGGSASVGGTFAWTTPSTQPGAGNPSESVTFTPTDTTDYNSVVGSVNVTVNKATPTVTTWPTASAITYGQTLASSTLSGGSASVGGTFAWTTPSTQPGAGNPSESVTFTPTDTTDYNSVAGSVNITVNKATPTVTTWPTASTITYGQTLASSTLSGGSASVGGTFAWTTPSTQPGAGTSGQSVTFTPTDTTDYNTVSGLVSVTVNKATPTVTTWPTASAITYGQTLASSTLSGGSASVGGTFAWTTPGTQPPVGVDAESVTFTPTDTTDYNTVVGSVNVTVNAHFSGFSQIDMQDGGYLTGVITHPSGRLICRTDGGGIYSSDTQGNSWTYLSGNMTTFASLTPQGIAVPQSSGSSSNLILQAVGYSNGGSDPGRGVWKTTDGGATWTQTLTGVNFLGNGNEREGGECIIFNPTNNSEAWVGTYNSGIWVSGDAGSTWTQDSTAPAMTNSSMYISPWHTNQLFAGGDGGLWVRTNSGATWTHLNTYSLVYRVSGGPDGTIYYCGMNGSSQLIQKITATDWTKTSTYTVTDLHSAYTSGIGDDGKPLLTATVLKDGRLVVSDAENYTRISANQGSSFTTLSFTYAPGIPKPQWANQSTFSWRCTSLVQDPVYTNNWYGGAGYGPLCTTNSGTNWQYIPNGIGEVVTFKIGFHPTDTNRIYIPCADLGGAIVTDSGISGNTVSMLHQFFTSDVIQCSHRALACTTNGYNRVIFTGWEEINTQPRIYSTINDGTSWYKPTCTGLPTSLNGAEILDSMDSLDNPDDFIVICGSASGSGKGGVYRTVNAGTNFSQCNWYPNNSINLSVHWDMFLDRDATNVNIRYMFSSVAYPSGNASTNSGGGFFISYDRGQNWTQLTGFTGGVIPSDWSDWIGKMSADHGISGHVWIALETSPTSCCHNGLAYSSNYGTNFSAVGGFTNAVAVDALNGNVAVLGQMTGDTWNKVYYSTNNGANWSQITATNYAFGNATDVTLDPHWAGRIWITTQERSVGIYTP